MRQFLQNFSINMSKTGEFIFICFYLLLAIFQIKTTNVSYSYSFTPYEIDHQIKRMNEYQIARLGYILEGKKEVQIIKKLENNFFTVIDFNEYFPNRVPYILSPFIFFGLYFFIKERNNQKLLFNTFLLTIIILTISGPFAKYGPVLIYPYFFLFILISIRKALKFKLI